MRAGVALFCVLTFGSVDAFAEDLTLRVGAEEKLFRALDRAAEHLAKCQTCTVNILVAGGEQRGKAQVGQWKLPETAAPRATLRILGGYDSAFATRAPFTHPTILVTSERRSGPVFEVSGRKTALKELHFSGFAIDVGAGNKYDAKTGQLYKGSSPSWPLVVFGLETERLIVADNIFLNAANSVGTPRIKPTSKNSETILRNNLFLNNVYCWQLAGLPAEPVVARYRVENNTFAHNYPYNPDRNTSNPGTLEIGNKYVAGSVEIRGNLFAHNSGGAVFAQWDDVAGPNVTLADNLFFRNGALFGELGDDKGAVVGKFNGSGVHGSYSAKEIAEDFSWKTSGNVSSDPSLPMPSVISGSDGQSEDTAGAGEPEESAEDGVEIVRNAEIDGFAHRMQLQLDRLPFPRTAGLKKYGASPEQVSTPEVGGNK
jgi:hypothetical protein